MTELPPVIEDENDDDTSCGIEEEGQSSLSVASTVKNNLPAEDSKK